MEAINGTTLQGRRRKMLLGGIQSPLLESGLFCLPCLGSGVAQDSLGAPVTGMRTGSNRTSDVFVNTRENTKG